MTLFLKEQIEDLSRFCFSGSVAKNTVIGIDKTFNLTNFHVTATTFINLSLLRQSTNDHSIFIGPILIHGNSTRKNFNEFFSILSNELSDTVSPPIFGTDEETAMRNAIKHCFPTSKLLTCTRHLKENTARNLRISTEQIQKEIIHKISGSGGLSSSSNDLVFDIRKCEISDFIQQHTPSFTHYFNNLAAMIKENIDISTHANIDMNWTNNNSESINHVLKQSINWKPKPVTELVDEIHNLVKMQYREMDRAFLGLGNYVLAPEYSHYKITQSTWTNMTEKQRQSHRDTFMKEKRLHQGRTVISTDGTTAILRSASDGKKTEQRQRKRTATTKKTHTNQGL